MSSLFDQICYAWPEARQQQDSIHVMYASAAFSNLLPKHPIEDIVDEIRACHQAGITKFIFFNSGEAILPIYLNKMQCAVNLVTEIDPSAFFFTTSLLSGPAIYAQLADDRKWTRRMTILTSHHFEMVTHQYMQQVTPEYKIRVKNKKFVCLNKIERPHRVMLLDWILSNDMLSDIYYSFEGQEPGWLERTHMFSKHHSDHWKEIINRIYEHKDLFPIRLNITPDRPNPVDLTDEDLSYHDNSYFSVVTETLFHLPDESSGTHGYPQRPGRYPVWMSASHGAFITEKTYRAIAFKHPFILLAMPGTLRALRDAGYRTFAPFIDESYDDEVSSPARLELVKNEINRLCAFTDEEWITWQTNIKEIVEHNFNLIKSPRPTGVTKFDF